MSTNNIILASGLTINPDLTAAQNMLALINLNSTYVFTGSEFTLGIPQEYVPTNPMDTSNTELIVSPTASSGFIGLKAIHYRRESLGYTRVGASFNFTANEGDTIDTVFSMICLEHGLLPSEIAVSGQLPDPGNSSTLILQAVAGSLFYIGDMTITVTVLSAS
jgi:hypothetical protein